MMIIFECDIERVTLCQAPSHRSFLKTCFRSRRSSLNASSKVIWNSYLKPDIDISGIERKVAFINYIKVKQETILAWKEMLYVYCSVDKVTQRLP